MTLAPVFRFFRRGTSKPTVRIQDPADLGTAFGMEASLEDWRQAPGGHETLESQRRGPVQDSPMDWVRRARG